MCSNFKVRACRLHAIKLYVYIYLFIYVCVSRSTLIIIFYCMYNFEIDMENMEIILFRDVFF